MTPATSLDLDDWERERVEQLCNEFDPEHFVPEWMKQRGDRVDWETYLRFMRDDLRAQLEVAVAFGDSLKRLVDTDFRIRLFYDLAAELTRARPGDDYKAADRFHQLFTKEETTAKATPSTRPARPPAGEPPISTQTLNWSPTKKGRPMPQIGFNDDERAEIERLVASARSLSRDHAEMQFDLLESGRSHMATRSPVVACAASYREVSLVFSIEVNPSLGRQLALPENAESGFC